MKFLKSIKVALLLLTMVCCAPTFADNTVTDETTTQTTTVSPSNATDDNSITASVQAKIAQDNSLSGTNVAVATQQGVVTLSGTVNSQAQANTVLNTAKSVAGVKDVKSNISVNNAVSQ
jgi:hyperosmotically inducible protein